jgi:hypothetical protein
MIKKFVKEMIERIEFILELRDWDKKKRKEPLWVSQKTYDKLINEEE